MIGLFFQTHSASLRAPLRSRFTALRSGRITRIMRKMARLAIFPNLLHCVPQTSHNPDVKSNILITLAGTLTLP